jgi:biopolymer transport protein ExbD
VGRFKRKQSNNVPGLNLASLPDLIFTVLFFFMIVTHMRDVDPKVQYNVPQGTELTKEVNKRGLVYIFIGKPVDAQGRVLSDETRIQMGDSYVTVADIGSEIAKERNRLSEEDRQHLTVTIRADRDTEMGIINDVKQELRKAGALNINYSAEKKVKKQSVKQEI